MKIIKCPEHILFSKILNLPPNKKVRFLRMFDKNEANDNFKALQQSFCIQTISNILILFLYAWLTTNGPEY